MAAAKRNRLLPGSTGLWIAVLIGVVLWTLAIAPIVSGLRDQRLLDADASCGWSFPAHNTDVPDGACTFVDARVTDREVLTVSIRGSDKHEVPNLTVVLPDGSSHDLDVTYDLYDATLVNGDAIRAQVFRGKIVRLKSGTSVDQTSESPVGRAAGSTVWFVFAICYTILFVLIQVQNRRMRIAGSVTRS